LKISEEVKEAFRVFDAAGDGKIAVEELRRLMTTMGDVMNNQEVCVSLRFPFFLPLSFFLDYPVLKR
jgi:Ca2+-binding EF-hand superfamily protein